MVVTVEKTNSIADQQVYITKPNYEGVNASFLAGIMASRLIAWYIRYYYDEIEDAFPQIKVGQLKNLPMPKIDLNANTGELTQTKLSNIVEQLIVLKEESKNIKTAHERTNLKRQFDAADRQIDKLVYELYGLTDEEIQIVEGKTP